MFTRSFLTVRTAPLPWQVGQGSSITVPAPPQREQGWEIENMPWPWVSIPRPSQRGQTIGVVPGFAPVPRQVGQVAAIGTWSGTCAPATAWSKVIETCASRSGPFSGRGLVRTRRPLAEPPKRFERMSPIEEPSKSKLPKPPKPPPGPAPVREGAGAAVVLRALLGVAEHVVRLGDLLEARLGLLVVGVAIGVVLAREFAVGLLDLLRGGALVHPERLVVVRSRRHRLCSSGGDDHSRRAEDRLAQPVAVLVDLDDGAARAALACGGRGDRLVDGGVEDLAVRVEGLDPARASAAASSSRTSRTPFSSGSSSAAASSARSRLSSAGSSSLASVAAPRSCAAAASRAIRLR